jgi:peptidoglycan/LPS O-acetylase OafA/YrhL
MNVLFWSMLAIYFLSMPQIRRVLSMDWGGIWDSPIYIVVIPAFLAVTLHAPVAERVLGNGFAKFFGNISYSVYLLHMPVLHWLTALPALDHRGIFLVVFLIATTAIAWLSFVLIERPARNFLRRPTLASRLRINYVQARS